MYVCVCLLGLFVCTCACEDEEEQEEGGVWKKESRSEPLQSETCAAAKENCGRKSLLIEHEVCHLKLESSQSPETAAGRHLSGPYIKVPPGPGCVSPSHRGPSALAPPQPPFRLRARPHRGTSRGARCAINAPALRTAPLRRLGSRYRSFPRKGRRSWGDEAGRLAARSQIHAFMQSVDGERPVAQVEAAQCGTVWLDAAALSWDFFVWQIGVHCSTMYILNTRTAERRNTLERVRHRIARVATFFEAFCAFQCWPPLS